MTKAILRGKNINLSVFTNSVRHLICVHNYIHLCLGKKARYKMHTYQIIAYTKKLKAKNMRNKRM